LHWDENVEKMVMRTMYGLYEFLVMPFKLCNVSSMFTTFMNSIFHERLDEFVIINIDDILVYSKTTKEHAKHLKYILSKLHENKLFVNWTKSEFTRKEMDFMGHILSWEGVRHGPKKLEAIRYWKRLIIVKDIQSFLSMVNFYQKFIESFSQLVKPFSNLLKEKLCRMEGTTTKSI